MHLHLTPQSAPNIALLTYYTHFEVLSFLRNSTDGLSITANWRQTPWGMGPSGQAGLSYASTVNVSLAGWLSFPHRLQTAWGANDYESAIPNTVRMSNEGAANPPSSTTSRVVCGPCRFTFYKRAFSTCLCFHVCSSNTNSTEELLRQADDLKQLLSTDKTENQQRRFPIKGFYSTLGSALELLTDRCNDVSHLHNKQ